MKNFNIFTKHKKTILISISALLLVLLGVILIPGSNKDKIEVSNHESYTENPISESVDKTQANLKTTEESDYVLNETAFCTGIGSNETVVCKDKNKKLLTGKVIEYFPNGKVHRKFVMKNGHADGLWQRFIENGKLQWETTFKDGKHNGVYKEYYENGNLKFETPFKDDKRNGVSKSYYENGNLKFETSFKDDKQNGGHKVYDTNGALVGERNYKDGKANGLSTEYLNGQISKEETYKDDKKNGPTRTYLNGNLREEIEYKNGMMDGVYILYTTYDGSIYQKKIYKNGRVIKTIK